MSDITDKIRKLLALATSDNPHEAAIAAQRAAELALRHGLDIDNLGKAEKSFDERSARFAKEWEVVISNAVAKLHGCVVYITNGEEIVFVGGKDEAHVATQIHVYLVSAIKGMNKISVNGRGLTKQERAAFRKNFRHSAAYTVANRLHQRYVELTTRDDEAQKTTGRNALVVLNHLKDKSSEADEYLKGKYKLKDRRARLPTIALDSMGAVEGVEAGKSISLDPMAGAPEERKQIT